MLIESSIVADFLRRRLGMPMADVVTRGTGNVERTADRAELSASYDAAAADQGSAVTALSGRVAAVERLLQHEDVEVRSRRLTVHAHWEGKRRAGWRANQQYTLRTGDAAVLDELLAGLIVANPDWLNGPNWDLADKSEAVREAQRLAVQDARQRAEGFASALGMRLGPLIRLDETGANHGIVHAREANMSVAHDSARIAGAVQELNLQPQPVTVSATCTTTWALLD
jgi:uncharacterized protein YggE